MARLTGGSCLQVDAGMENGFEQWFSLPFDFSCHKIHRPHHLSIVLRYIASGKCSFTLSTLYELLGEKIREAHKSRKSNKGRVAEQDLDLISDRPTGSHDRL
ncbi:hypothetical protein SELMODRAFT_426395 [Selaginella moellendorffii]|uniref:Uncharacterized protein n=1 Tax=Selaginella moellendorffii TaxID=88036 RepID=D8SW88_SELML|nr:hypothetical protein SELMODRAFT_426395 [Selaginella moellendorffii]